MTTDIRITPIRGTGRRPEEASLFGTAAARIVRCFHRSIPGYAPTPLHSLDRLAEHCGLARFWVKDESYRFGLNAFKSLGGTRCIAAVMAERLGIDPDEADYAVLSSPESRERLGDLTFITATDGNHGRGVAWAAKLFGMKSVVYMPAGSAAERLENIRRLGARADITGVNYDDTVRFAASEAERCGFILTQDTAWPGYERIPSLIMQGYLTMAEEAVEALDGEVPTHVFLQAGVGSMAGALAAYFAERFGDERPIVTIVEPHAADCIYRTAEADDGRMHAVTGVMNSIMAGLCCGEPCTTAWKLIREYADFSASMPDGTAAKGMRVLGNPLPGDPAVTSGESGAAGVGLAAELMMNPGCGAQRRLLGLGADSRVLCFSTEGATDRANYRRIVWDGLFPSF
ncbi:MAG: diaminopropionate ammonia-lyase [Sutterella sp.]|nr:diaminopropionate ammonia-lyase [Sutterella sp.]